MDDGDFEIPSNTKLLIIPDAGTNDTEKCNRLIEQGIDIIILDHHEAEDIACENKAIIVNNQISDDYTCKSFSGVGIAYEFAKALDDEYVCDLANKYLDLVAFGNVSDVMDIRNAQTRYYIEQGMKNINNKFLQAIAKAQEFSTKGKVNIHNISWYWTPICNSMIRIGSLEDRDLLFRAFIETDEVFPYKKRGSTEFIDEDIYTRAARLCKNIKSKQDKLRDKLCEELKEQVNQEDKVAILIANDADAGIVGLSTMRLAEWANKPCIVLIEHEEGVLGGSARNFNNSPIKDFKEVVQEIGLFNFAQGHSNAFGCSLNTDKLQEAREALNNALENYHYDDTIYCDFVLDAEDVDYWFVKTIDDSQWLYGTGIEEPVVAVENITVSAEDCMVMGQNLDSIAFMYNGIKYCKFKCKEDDELLNFVSGASDTEIALNLVGKCSMSTYKDATTAQFIIDDYEITI